MFIKFKSCMPFLKLGLVKLYFILNLIFFDVPLYADQNLAPSPNHILSKYGTKIFNLFSPQSFTLKKPSPKALGCIKILEGTGYDSLYYITLEHEKKGVLRVFNPGRSNGKNKCIIQATQLASDLNIGPKLLLENLDHKFILTEFIEGRPLKPQDLEDKIIFKNLIVALKEFHTAHIRSKHSFSIKASLCQKVLNRLDELKNLIPNTSFLENLKILLQSIPKVVENSFVLIHGDIRGSNILLQKDHIVKIIDFGEAGWGSIFEDLGSLAFFMNLNTLEKQYLLNTYFGKLSFDDLKKLESNALLAGLHHDLWTLREKLSKPSV